MASTSRASQPRPFSLERLEALLALEDVTWRHDIDCSLTASLQMAELQARQGVSATYYVMARSPYYNPFSHHAIKTIRRIADLGHTLGVHVDLDAPRDMILNRQEITRASEYEHKLLARLYPVTCAVSFHCPPACVLWRDIDGFESAYAPQWQGRYFADSRGAFLYGDPEDSDVRPLLVNLHPEHWFAADEQHEAFWR